MVGDHAMCQVVAWDGRCSWVTPKSGWEMFPGEILLLYRWRPVWVLMKVKLYCWYFLSELGEVSESLLSDQNLTPWDFLGEPLETLKSSQEDYDVYCASPSPAKRNEFKTPLTSRYSNKASVTPSLFSQDESVHLTPVLSEFPVKCM